VGQTAKGLARYPWEKGPEAGATIHVVAHQAGATLNRLAVDNLSPTTERDEVHVVNRSLNWSRKQELFTCIVVDEAHEMGWIPRAKPECPVLFMSASVKLFSNFMFALRHLPQGQ
jgi:hypothetical protein